MEYFSSTVIMIVSSDLCKINIKILQMRIEDKHFTFVIRVGSPCILCAVLAEGVQF